MGSANHFPANRLNSYFQENSSKNKFRLCHRLGHCRLACSKRFKESINFKN